MFFRNKAYLLDKDLSIIATIYMSIQPDDGTATFRDDSFSSLSLRLDTTHTIYTKNRKDLDYTQYIFYEDMFYKILDIVKYKNYIEIKAYECKNVQNKELTGVDTDEGTSYILEVK